MQAKLAVVLLLIGMLYVQESSQTWWDLFASDINLVDCKHLDLKLCHSCCEKFGDRVYFEGYRKYNFCVCIKPNSARLKKKSEAPTESQSN